MYCSKCGKEISDQARFCNYCGMQVNTQQPQPEKKPVQQTTPPPSAPVQTAKPKKKGKAGKRFLSILVAVIVYLVVRYAAESLLTEKPKAANTKSNSSSTVSLDQESIADACAYGALYQDGYLTYGMTKLHMPGYTLLPGEAGERDYLMNADGSCMFASNKQMEILEISFDATNRESMLKSLQNIDSNAELVDYEEYYINGYPIIRCISRCNVEGTDQYIGELIVFPAEVTKETIRLNMYELAEYGYEEISTVFESLNIYPHFAPKASDTNVFGFNRITVR